MTEEDQRKSWLEERRTGLGGSDIAAILGENPHMTALDVYRSKVEPVVEQDSPALQRGRALEPIIRAIYREKTGRSLLHADPMIRDRSYPMLIANVDGFLTRPVSPNPVPADHDDYEIVDDGVLEIKAPGLRVFSKMLQAGIPKAYHLQIQHYMGVTGKRFGSFAAFSAERWQLLHFDVERDDELINVMRKVSIEWWETHVVKRVPPDEERIELPAEFQVPTGEVAQVETPAWRSAVRGYLEAKELLEMAEELKESAKAECVAAMGDFRVVEGGGVRAFNTMQAGRKTFDRDKLVAAKPLDRHLVIDAIAWIMLHNAPPTPDKIIERLSECAMDLAPFHKLGKPFPTFRLFPLSKRLTSGE